MKKGIIVLIIVAIFTGIFLLVGCRDEEVDSNTESISMALVVPSAFGDLSFNDSAKEGAKQLEEEYNVAVTYIECNEENYKQNMVKAADEAEIVVCIGWEFWEIEEVANQYPENKFIWIDNESEEQLENLLCVSYAQNEGSFLAGYIAAWKSESGILGVVGGDDSKTINDFIIGFEQGAKEFNPEIQVIKNYAGGNYSDPKLGKKLAIELYEEGADIVFQVAGSTGNGVFEAAKEKGFLAIGVDEDQKISVPEYEDVIICSMTKEIGMTVKDIVSNYLEDEHSFVGGRTWLADMSNGYVGVSYGAEDQTQFVTDEIKEQVEELREKIIAGEIVVESLRGINEEDLEADSESEADLKSEAESEDDATDSDSNTDEEE